MSGIGEASLVLGLVSSTIAIFEAAQEIYEAASDTSGLPKKLRMAAEQIPLVHNALSLAKQNINTKCVTEEAIQSAIPVLQQCEKSAASVKNIFDKTIPAKDAPRSERLRKAMGLKMKSNKVKEYIEEIFKSMELLAQHQLFQDAEALEDIKAAIEQLTNATDEEEQPQFVHSGAGAINANTGGGTQKNYNNSGTGTQYNAEKQFFGRDQGDPSVTLEIAEEAAFDAVGRDYDQICLPGTRIDLLRDIRSWLSSDSPKHTYWLSGWAGTGKSTIARTIAHDYTNSQWQLGSFFFSRGGGDAGHIYKFVGTLATQLSYRWPAYKSALQKAIAADEGIVRKTQKAQWAALIVKPLSELLASPSPQRVLLVVDAVDECGTDDDMSHIVELLLQAQGVNQTALRIFVTSRPEVPIRSRFDHDLDQHHLNLVLHQVSEYVVQKDLFIFLHHHFTKIRELRRLGVDWPDVANIHRLVVMSGNLFIWAATVCRFVSKGGRLVKNRLSAVLMNDYNSGGPETALDRIYLMVLEDAIGNDLSDGEKVEATYYYRHTLGTIALLFAPLSVIGLADLLGVETKEIEQTLADLHSILDVPSGTERPIRLHHPSFRDFLYDRSRCRNDSLCVDKITIHGMLADRCINVMSVLQKDICGLENPGIRVEEIESTVVTQYLSSAIQYSCHYWLDHSERGYKSLNDDGPVHRFLRRSCPYWLEAMSLVGRIPEAITMMTRLESLIDEKKAPKLHSLVRDTLRFIHTFSHVLNRAPLQLYSAGLFFSPFHSIFRKSFGIEAQEDIKVIAQVPDEWNACIKILEGHSGAVYSVVFSPDGSRMASGSGDGTVRIWDVQTGQCQHTLKSYLDGICSVVFSPDGSRVASCSGDKTVRIWDVQTGECQYTLKGHSRGIDSVVFSPDGSRVASRSRDKTVRIWDVQTGECQYTLENYSSAICSVVFSPDGFRVASCSGDKTVRIWDVQTGECQYTLKGHSRGIDSVVFSPDGSRVASGSYDQTVRIWDVQTGECQHTLEGHSGWNNSVVFSPDGSRVASGSGRYDKTVRIWDVKTGEYQSTLKGHLDAIYSLIFSPDGSRVATGSGDEMVQIWDVQTGECQYTLKGHSSGVHSVVFSPDGSQVASGSRDQTVRIWDVQTGESQHTLNSHSRRIYTVVFSPDGSRVATGSGDETVRIWDVQTGECQHTLEGHSSEINSVVFSPDGSRVASGSDDQTVRIWDVQTGESQHTLNSHLDTIYSVAFSPDGSQVASGSQDKTVRIWDVQTDQCQHTLKGHSAWIDSVVFSRDGSRVASGSGDKTVRIWDVQTGQCQHTLKGHSAWIDSVVFSSDGSRVAAGSIDKTVRIWNIANSTEILRCYAPNPHDLRFINDNSELCVNGILISLSPQILSPLITAGSGEPLVLLASMFGISDDWLTLYNERILWLPSEYRPGTWACFGHTIVIGSSTGRVTFVRCSAARSSSSKQRFVLRRSHQG